MNVVFTYGRFNPPHKGHKMMIERIVKLAKKLNKKPVVVVSHSTGTEKNPMNVNEKIKILPLILCLLLKIKVSPK